jgi:hypothetical protein
MTIMRKHPQKNGTFEAFLYQKSYSKDADKEGRAKDFRALT